MRKKFLIKLTKLVFVTSLLSTCFTKDLQAQRPVPKMWVHHDEALPKVNWFNTRQYGNSKKSLLYKKIGYYHPQNFRIPVSGFRSLIDTLDKIYLTDTSFRKLNLYITSFNITCPGPLSAPSTKNKQFVLVFAPAGDNNTDIGKYFIINPKDNLCEKIPIDIKDCWAGNYISNIVNGVGGLASTLDSDDEYNDAPDGSTSDTRRIIYNYSHFKEFIDDERRYQNENGRTNPSGKTISHIQITFASYTITGIGDNDYGYPEDSFKDRLIVFFDFVRNGNVFYIEDLLDFPERLKVTKSNKALPFFDNGQLCPPSTNCPTGRR